MPTLHWLLRRWALIQPIVGLPILLRNGPGNASVKVHDDKPNTSPSLQRFRVQQPVKPLSNTN